MVEMLGVLAVMGLLTIIGIAGFKIAMNKAKANNLVADMNRLAHIVVMDKFSGYSDEAIQRAVNEHNQGTEYPANCNSRFKSTMFSLENKNPIDKTLCEQVAGLDWKVPLGVFINGVQKENFTAEDCTDSNTLTWIFMDDLSSCPDCILSDTHCDDYGRDCGSCSDLRGYTRDDSACNNNANGQYCVLGYCSPCNVGQTLYNNSCKACSEINWLVMPADDCHKCVDENNNPTHFWRGQYTCDKCTSAGDSFAGGTSIEECRRCSNRCLKGSNCVIPGLANNWGDFTNYTRGDDGYCDCAEGAFWVYGGGGKYQEYCTTCSQLTTSKFTTVEGCHSCVNDQNQPTHFMRSGGAISVCDPCNDTGDSSVGGTSIEECRRCSNRCLKNGQCGVAGVSNRHIDLTNYTRGDDGYCVYVGE